MAHYYGFLPDVIRSEDNYYVSYNSDTGRFVGVYYIKPHFPKKAEVVFNYCKSNITHGELREVHRTYTEIMKRIRKYGVKAAKNVNKHCYHGDMG